MQFNHCAAHAGFQWDYVFDWTIMKYQHQQPRIPPALEGGTQREVRRTPQDEERERHGSSFNRTGAAAEGSRRRWALSYCPGACTKPMMSACCRKVRKGAAAGAVAREGLILQAIASGCLQTLQVLIVVYVIGVRCNFALFIAGIELLEGRGGASSAAAGVCQ